MEASWTLPSHSSSAMVALTLRRTTSTKAVDGVCNVNKEKKHIVTIDSYEDVPPNDENALKKVGILNRQFQKALDRPSGMHVGELSCARC